MDFTAVALAEAVRSKRVSPVELVRDCLARIERRNAALHAFITVDADGALNTARTLEAEAVGGRFRGPLHGVPVAHVERMLERYGDEVPAVLAAVREDPALGNSIGGHLGAELRYAVTHEGAGTLSDVMTRRTHIAIEEPDGGTELAPAVAALIAPLLGWDEGRIAREIATYRTEVEHDRAAL